MGAAALQTIMPHVSVRLISAVMQKPGLAVALCKYMLTTAGCV